MVNPVQGEVWWAEAEDTRRPVVVVTRSAVGPILSRVVVAPVTRTVRHIPTEIPLDTDNGLAGPCVASFDNLQSLPRALLGERVGALRQPRLEICRARSALADC
ncbi:MAG: type II toxin-antitoxin system PemK/MazF family toxin [Actinomycetota bacterium]|nr:type II toxin-antitoxin system PemK/MazF family toxin [Actinomycetota bacterium]